MDTKKNQLMDSDDFDRYPERALSHFVTTGLDSESVWHLDDLAAMLTHQLALPLDQELAQLSGISSDDVRSLATHAKPPIHTFGDLLIHPSPSYDLLDQVKRYTKLVRSKAQDPMLQQVVSLVYYAAIAAAWLRHGRRLTSLDGSIVHEGLQWSLERPWLDPSLAPLFRDALAGLTPDNDS